MGVSRKVNTDLQALKSTDTHQQTGRYFFRCLSNMRCIYIHAGQRCNTVEEWVSIFCEACFCLTVVNALVIESHHLHLLGRLESLFL